MVKHTTIDCVADRCIPASDGVPTGRLLAFPHPFPIVPTLLATRIQLELLLAEPLIDLCAVSAAVLRDPGATLQVLRLAGPEYWTDAARPVRMEECLAGLDSRAWFDAICAATIDADSETAELCAAWIHAGAVAQIAMELAERLDGYSPEEACLVGLLHELEDLPALLGWDRGRFPDLGSAEQMAHAWGLPRRLVLSSEKPTDSERYWAALLNEAHRRLRRRDRVA